MTRRLKLYPNHQHQWAEDLLGSNLLRCAICHLQMPRQLVRLDQNSGSDK